MSEEETRQDITEENKETENSAADIGPVMHTELAGWKAMNLRERIFLIVGTAFALSIFLMMQLAPIQAFSGWAALPAAAAAVCFMLCKWRQCVYYERVCFLVLSAAVIFSLIAFRFIFVTPTDWGFPLFVVCMTVMFLMMSALLRRKNRMESIMFLVLGLGYPVVHLAKWVYKLITQSP